MGLHVAIVGSGRWSRVHLAALSVSEYVSRVTLVGRNRAALDGLAAEFPIVDKTSTELATALNDSTVELVDVVLPHHLHFETSVSALSAGKHVVCEKPASITLDQLDSLATTAAEVKRRFLVVMNQLYNPVNHRVRQLVDDGAIGRPFLLVENAYSNHSQYYRDPDTWRTRLATSGGGTLIDGGYHMVYKQLYWLAGQGYPSWVTAETAQLAIDPGGSPRPDLGEDFVGYTAGYDDHSLRINASHAWTLAADVSNPRFGLLAGSDKTLELPVDDSQPLVIRDGHSATAVDIPPGPTSNIDTMRACLADYVECIVGGRPQTHGSFELARRTLEFILAVYESSATGGRVKLSE